MANEIQNLHFEMSKSWDTTSREFIQMKRFFPARMGVFYAAMSRVGVKLVRDELMSKVYSRPLPKSASWGGEPSPRTGRTLLAVKGTWTLMRSTVFVDRRAFPRFFYPYILEHGRQSSSYYARHFFRDAMAKMEAIYFREARAALKGFLFERGFL